MPTPPASRRPRWWRVRELGNLVNLSTPVGLGLARLGGARLSRASRGLWLAESYRWNFPRAGAFTVGNVILSSSALADLEAGQPDVLAHEERHAWQYFWLLGLPFLPGYLLACGWSWLRTGDVASRNVFELHAGLDTGGYVTNPVDNQGFRALGRGVRRLTRRRRIRP